MVFKEIENNKEDYIDLLLEADPDKIIIDNYLYNGKMYGLFKEGQLVCVAVIVKIDENTYELKNIATSKEHRGEGYGKQIIQYIFGLYRDKCKTMIVGTTENMIPFYVLSGFTKYHHTVKNFFIDNYQEEIWDGDLHCIDMYYYQKSFK